MFGRTYIAVLNFLATKVEIVIAEKVVNNNIRIVARAIKDYSGYIDGNFIDEYELKEVVKELIGDLSNDIHKRLDNLYIGVPAQFCNYAIKNLKATYTSKVLIRKKHIDALFASVKDDSIDDGYIVETKSPIYYVLDDGVQTMEPENNYSKNLGAKASCILVRNEFISLFLDIMAECGIKDYSFVPEPLAIDAVLLDEVTKQTGAIVINFDYVYTCVTSFVGEGIVDMKSFAIGEGHVLSDLCEVVKINYLQAEDLKKKLILSLQPNPMDSYEVANEKGNIIKISASIANEVVKARLDRIAEVINSIIINFQYKQDPSNPIYLTGSGIVNIKGAKNYLASRLNRKCKILIPNQMEFRKPKFASLFGLINFVYDKTV